MIKNVSVSQYFNHHALQYVSVSGSLCDSNPCQNGGTCVAGCNYFVCDCGDDLPGDLCQGSKYIEDQI